MNKRTLLCAALTVYAGAALGYKEGTHKEFSSKAVTNSVLGANPDFLRSIGIESPTETFPNSEGKELSIEQLFRFGAEHEDSGDRPLHHFFDPEYDRPLTVFGSSFTWEKSPDWILDGKDQPAAEEEFSYRKAQEHFLQALSAPEKTDRERAWGLTFQNLGHVIHHIQDMAQPQHVRNDQHLDRRVPLLRDPSYYEEYTALNPGKWQPLLGQAGAPVLWDRARYYWTGPGSDGMADFTNRNFVSKDTNFQIKDNEAAANPEYPLPQPGASSLLDIEDPMHGLQADPINRTPSGKDLCDKFRNDPRVRPLPGSACYIEFIASDVRGLAQFPVGENKRAASLSVFDQYLRDLDQDIQVRSPSSLGGYTVVDRVPTLNRFNFDSGYPFLIPRAVAYSAGLINHFFRGKIDLIEDPEKPGKSVIQNQGDEEMEGEFTIYYEDWEEVRHTLTSTGTVLLAPGATLPISVPLLPRIPRQLVLVFRGRLGQEGSATGNMGWAVAGRVLQPFQLPAFEAPCWDQFLAALEHQSAALDLRNPLEPHSVCGGSAVINQNSGPPNTECGNHGQVPREERECQFNSGKHTLLDASLDYEVLRSHPFPNRIFMEIQYINLNGPGCPEESSLCSEQLEFIAYKQALPAGERGTLVIKNLPVPADKFLFMRISGGIDNRGPSLRVSNPTMRLHD